MRPNIARTRAVAALGVALLVVASAAPSAQRRNRRVDPDPGLPVATNTIRQQPDRYDGAEVTLSAGVDAVLSPTAFVVDQRKVTGPTTVEPIDWPMLVIAPPLARRPAQDSYLLIRGRIARLDAALLAGGPGDAPLELAPDVAARYAGRPVLLATSVLDSRRDELVAPPSPGGGGGAPDVRGVP